MGGAQDLQRQRTLLELGCAREKVNLAGIERSLSESCGAQMQRECVGPQGNIAVELDSARLLIRGAEGRQLECHIPDPGRRRAAERDLPGPVDVERLGIGGTLKRWYRPHPHQGDLPRESLTPDGRI